MTESSIRDVIRSSSDGSSERETNKEEKEQNMSQPRAYEPWPLDFRILEMLPDKGLIGNVHWKGRRVKDLVDEIGREYVTPDGVAARLREMKRQGYVEQFAGGGGGGAIWARIDKSKALLAKKGEYLDES